MKILIFNWRDLKNPDAGGAELLTYEMARQWVLWGHEVTLFCSEFKGCADQELFDGVKIIRKGVPDARYIFDSVHWRAFTSYIKNFRGNFDVVVDEIHGLPFFTNLYVKEKKIVLICEVADNLWIEIYGLLFGNLGKFIENFYLRFMYKNISYLTISESTKKELVDHGVDSKMITVLPMGITVAPQTKSFNKEKDFTIIFLGRLSKPKGVEDALYALKLIIQKHKNAKLWIVGHGSREYVESLKKISEKDNLQKNVVFYGFVSQQKKFELLSKAHILVVPSIKEGWGLTVPEAAVVGTPSVTYKIQGLKDIFRHGEYGVQTKINTPEEMSKEAISLFEDKKRYDELIKRIQAIRKEIGWKNTSRVALEFLKN